jgi:hypothetical protein
MVVKAPFPYFGNKITMAQELWWRFGAVENYVSPFCGSLGVELNAPYPVMMTLNDKDGLLVNFYRAVKDDPDTVAYYLDHPVSEIDLFSRHVYLVNAREQLTAQLEADPEWYDAKAGAWWAWGMCSWIGTGWCSGDGPWSIDADGNRINIREITDSEAVGVNRQMRHLTDAGTGVNRQMPALGDRKTPNLGNAGKGVNRKLPSLGDEARGYHTEGVRRKISALSDAENLVNQPVYTAGVYDTESVSENLRAYMRQIASLIRLARMTCGDWRRVVKESVTVRHGLTAVLLDPPYGEGQQDYGVGGNTDGNIADDGRTVPDGWQTFEWKSKGGYSVQGTEDAQSKVNRGRERIWFSPHCINPAVDAKSKLSQAIKVRETTDLGPLFMDL